MTGPSRSCDAQLRPAIASACSIRIPEASGRAAARGSTRCDHPERSRYLESHVWRTTVSRIPADRVCACGVDNGHGGAANMHRERLACNKTPANVREGRGIMCTSVHRRICHRGMIACGTQGAATVNTSRHAASGSSPLQIPAPDHQWRDRRAW